MLIGSHQCQKDVCNSRSGRHQFYDARMNLFTCVFYCKVQSGSAPPFNKLTKLHGQDVRLLLPWSVNKPRLKCVCGLRRPRGFPYLLQEKNRNMKRKDLQARNAESDNERQHIIFNGERVSEVLLLSRRVLEKIQQLQTYATWFEGIAISQQRMVSRKTRKPPIATVTESRFGFLAQAEQGQIVARRQAGDTKFEKRCVSDVKVSKNVRSGSHNGNMKGDICWTSPSPWAVVFRLIREEW